MRDLRVALRMWLKSPGFAAIAVLTLAVGIGANTTIFTLVNAVLLRPFPYPRSQELVYAVTRMKVDEIGLVSGPDFADWREQCQSFARMGAFTSAPFNLRTEAESLEVSALLAGKDVFDVYGMQPLVGRSFAPEEYLGSGQRVVMLGEKIWRQQYRANPDLGGLKVYLNGERYSVIGVLPLSMASLGWEWGWKTKADVCLPLDPKEAGLNDREARLLTVIGRLKPKISETQAKVELAVVANRLAEQHPATNKGVSATVKPIGEVEPGVRGNWIFLSVAVGCVLLIACANIANMLLAQAVSRAKEMGVRTALGASPARIVKQLLTESLMLSLFGGTLGILMSHWGVAILAPRTAGWLGGDMGTLELTVDWRVLLFTLLISAGSTFIFGLVPALRTARVDIAQVLQEGDRGSSGGPKQRFLMRSLVVAEVAVSLMLLVGAATSLKTIVDRLVMGPGYDAEHVAYIRLGLLGAKYEEIPQRVRFVEDLAARLRGNSGISTVAASASLPRGGIPTTSKVYPSSHPPRRADGARVAAFCPVSPEYFSLANMTLLKGRGFTEQDRAGSRPVAIINENVAQKVFDKGRDPVGQQISLPEVAETPFEVIGVVHAYTNNALALAVFGSIAQRCNHYPYLLVRTKGNPATLLPTLRSELKAADPDQPSAAVSTMREQIRESLGWERGALALLGFIGGAGCFLAVVGIGSVVSYAVAQRTREYGIRISLGATRGQILRLALREATIPLGIGVSLGFIGSLILQPLVWRRATGMDPSEYPMFLGVSLLFAVVALAASSQPARRATRITPMEALRSE